ncbi:hypothetical protein THAOC_26090, partial [Thalassiosira oceanica]
MEAAADDARPPVQASLDESKRRRDLPILWPESLESARQEDNGGTVEDDSDFEGNDKAIKVLSRRPTGYSSPTRSQYEKRVSENEAGNDLQELVNVITELADKENEVVPGLDVDIPTFLKSHLLFDHLYAFLLAWETLGGLDEQNIESTHPEFNELIRRFGTTRGARLKALVFQEHLFNRADFQNDVVEEMLSDTRRHGAIKQTVNDEDLEMHQLEKAMNQNETLRWTPEGVTEFDTSIKVCDQCCKRLIGFGMANHMQEYHSGTITTDRCFNVEQQMLRE